MEAGGRDEVGWRLEERNISVCCMEGREVHKGKRTREKLKQGKSNVKMRINVKV